jgi:hypothetical protein
MIKRLSPLLGVLLLSAACTQMAVHDDLTIEPSQDSYTVTVTAETRFELHPRHDAARARVEAAQAAAIAGTDPWSIRFARLSAPDEERVTYQKSHGALEVVTHSAKIAEDDLQHLLADTNITVDFTHGEGWSELALYPGSGGRATREQQREFDAALEQWSQSVVRYFTAVHHLYSYLNEFPGRERYVFASLVQEHPEDAPLTEDERPLVDAVVDAMGNIATQMDAQEGHATTLAEEADLIFNPFPARVTVRVPGDVIATEGFSTKSKALVIEQVDLFKAIAALEGRWITPDPLAAVLREDGPSPEQLAEAPRKSQAVVSSTEIARAIREQLVRPRMYSVRWRD